MEKPPKGDSQSNGAIEETGKAVREMKVLKDAIELKINQKLKVEATSIQWMVRWSADRMVGCASVAFLSVYVTKSEIPEIRLI